jgi:hypothetical protein
MFLLGAASKLVATGGTYPIVSLTPAPRYLLHRFEDVADISQIVVKSRLVSLTLLILSIVLLNEPKLILGPASGNS